jgi:hypothetical protein
VLRDYFNKNFQFYGRQLRFFQIKSSQSGEDPTVSRSGAYRAADEYKVFMAYNEISAANYNELTRRGVVTFSLGIFSREYLMRYPYGHSVVPDATSAVEVGAEFLCKRLAGKPPRYTDDPNFDQTKPRKFGILAFQMGESMRDNAPLMQRLVKQQCNIDISDVVEYDIEGANSSNIATAISKMKLAGVTSIVALTDFAVLGGFMGSADNQAYFPEWYIPAFGGVEAVITHQGYSKTQSKHMFGVSYLEIPFPTNADSECARAYHTIDPSTTPDANICLQMWTSMVQMASAIQLAGPKLTPDSIETALVKFGVHPPDPPWRMAGGYGPNDPSYPDYVAEMWYDPTAIHPNGAAGAFRYIHDGKRTRKGELTPGDSDFFTDPGITSAPR